MIRIKRLKIHTLIMPVLIGMTGYAEVWQPDLGNGMYKNPVIFADYSDPDVVRVGEDFYMTASSFNCVPALPVLHSRDLVNWTLVNHAIPRFEDPDFDRPQHGNGVWAPAIRYHEGSYYIYYGDPDRGIYMVKTEDPLGEWNAPVLVKKAYGNIDPCPFWDDDGRVYMVHAFAHSRAGVNSLLQINELNAQGSGIIDKGVIVFDGHQNYPTIEGPKLYKRNGYYYIFAPAGGVKPGWQTVLRSREITGPYEDRIVLAQGSTEINGPHQGAYLELENGEAWFVHFQDRDAYGRIVHLQPVIWREDWPVMGTDTDNDGTGEPILKHTKPGVRESASVQIPQTSDDFNKPELGLQWQWQANPKEEWNALDADRGVLRLNAWGTGDGLNLWDAPNLLLQKLSAPRMTVATAVSWFGRSEKERSGLIVMGMGYAALTISGLKGDYDLELRRCVDAEHGEAETIEEKISVPTHQLFLKVDIQDDAVCTFSYSLDGKDYRSIGSPFKARPGKWIGAKVGLFSVSEESSGPAGYAEYRYFYVN
ncbi:glycoside hydrolase 43 family protein [bacterium]|nr:glycoside hydrolase 43 family protein [bacterium]